MMMDRTVTVEREFGKKINVVKTKVMSTGYEGKEIGRSQIIQIIRNFI